MRRDGARTIAHWATLRHRLRRRCRRRSLPDGGRRRSGRGGGSGFASAGASLRGQTDLRGDVEVTCPEAGGGISAHTAVAYPWLGMRAAPVAYVGDDQPGREAVASRQTKGIDTPVVRLDLTVPTDRNFVLRVGHERTIPVHHEQHDLSWSHLQPAEVPSWLFLSLVGRNAHGYESQIVDRLETTPEASLAFEPGTLQIARGAEQLDRLFRRSTATVLVRVRSTSPARAAFGRQGRRRTPADPARLVCWSARGAPSRSTCRARPRLAVAFDLRPGLRARGEG
jgi:hypothetical protein